MAYLLRQEQIRKLLADFAAVHGATPYKDGKAFLTDLREIDRAAGVRLSAPEIKAVLSALGERDETAEICRDRDGNSEPDPDLRDTESVPLKEGITEYVQREVLPQVPDAWIDESLTKVGYEIPSTGTSTGTSRPGRWRRLRRIPRPWRARSSPCSRRSRHELPDLTLDLTYVK